VYYTFSLALLACSLYGMHPGKKINAATLPSKNYPDIFEFDFQQLPLHVLCPKLNAYEIQVCRNSNALKLTFCEKFMN